MIDVRRRRAAGDQRVAPAGRGRSTCGGRRAARPSPDHGDSGGVIDMWRARERSTMDLRRLRAAGDRHAAPTGGRRASRLSPDIGDGGDEINVWRARGRSTIGVRRDLVQGLAAKKQLVGVVA